MPLALLFWVLMLLWLIFGLWSNWPGQQAPWGPYGPFGSNLLLFIVLVILGWAVFGAAIRA